MNIGIISKEYIINASGSEKGVQHLAESLAKKGIEVHVITSYYKDHKNNYNGVYVHPVLYRITKKWLYDFIEIIPTIFQIIKLSKKYNIKILNVHGYRTEGLSTVLSGKILNIPTVLTWIHADIGFEMVSKRKTLLGALILKKERLMAKLCVKLSDKIMLKGIPPDVFLEKYNVNREKIFHTPNPIKIPKDTAHYQNNEIHEKYNFNDNFIVTIVSTRLERERGIDNILRTAKIIKEKNIRDVRFMIVGGRVPHILNYWKKKAKDYQVKDYVIFTGYQEDVYPFLYYSDLYIAGLKAEVGWGRAQLEAMAMELPIISRKTKTFSFWFKHLHDVYLLDRPTPENFAEAIIYLKENDALRTEIGKNARETILEDWDMEKFTDRFVKICENIVVASNNR